MTLTLILLGVAAVTLAIYLWLRSDRRQVMIAARRGRALASRTDVENFVGRSVAALRTDIAALRLDGDYKQNIAVDATMGLEDQLIGIQTAVASIATDVATIYANVVPRPITAEIPVIAPVKKAAAKKAAAAKKPAARKAAAKR